MMKRIMACLVAVVCLLTSFAFADGLYMKVVNVNEAVNMRKGPSTDTEALTQVPVGTIVTDCVKEGKWVQVNYNGTIGYIRGDKLQEVEAPAEQPAVAEGEPLVAAGEPLAPTEEEKAPKSILENVENAPVESYNEETEYDDDFVILDTVANGVRIIGRQIYQPECEYLMAVGLDASGKELWKNETTTDSITELMQTDVFIAGTADAPLVMMYNACRGLTAVNPATGEVVWEIFKKDLNLGGSISHAVDGNGVAYIAGYYGPDPVAIDANGNVLWQASSGSAEATWLYRMELSDEGIACSYGKMAGEEYGTIVYDFSGNVVSIVNE